VPAAVVTLGLARHAITSGEAAAIMLAALASLALCALGAARLAAGRDLASASGRAQPVSVLRDEPATAPAEVTPAPYEPRTGRALQHPPAGGEPDPHDLDEHALDDDDG
jgi:hypothetical protein